MDTNLTTEKRNAASESLDTLSALEIVRLMNAEDERVAPAVGQNAVAIAAAIDIIAERLRSGGRLIYLGAGTSGRLGVLDATECPPTFNSPPGQVLGLIAGGYEALTRAIEGAEDRPELAVEDLERIGLSAADTLVGIATSGRTPYVLAGLNHARGLGALAIAVSCNDDSTVADQADLAISPIVGPEVLSGSTRLKAGTATKMVLNMLSTGAMVRLGKTFGNLMVDLRATNRKLRGRTERIVRELTGLGLADTRLLLQRCNAELKTAVVAHRRGVEPDVARNLLRDAQGHLRTAIGSPPTMAQPETAADLVIAIDVGGTKVAATVAQIDDCGQTRPMGRGIAGPANPQSIGWELAIAEIELAIRRALVDAGLAGPRCVAAMTIAGAGMGRREDRSRLAAYATKHRWAEAIDVVDDAQPVLAAGTPDGWGIAIIAGTGSLVLGRSNDGRTCRAGGWGPLLGDDGSGYALALGGLRAVCQACDGTGPATHLVAALFKAMNIDLPEQMVPAIYATTADRRWLAALAPVVTQAAQSGDAVARTILDVATTALAAQVTTVAVKLGGAEVPWPLALAGGVLVHSTLFRERLVEHIQRGGVAIAGVEIVTEPAAGAVRLAAELRRRYIHG